MFSKADVKTLDFQGTAFLVGKKRKVKKVQSLQRFDKIQEGARTGVRREAINGEKNESGSLAL